VETIAMELPRSQVWVSGVLQVLAAVILLQTLFFKFTGAEESIYIFRTLGMEPVGRIGSGVAELIAAALLLHPRTAAVGGIIAMALMAGAILSHLTVLGIEVMNDRGLLFVLAWVVLLSSAAVVVIRRAQLPLLGRYFEVAA
jgi:hypothetical protein